MLVAKPSFLSILDDAHNMCGAGDTSCDDIFSNISFYSSATYIMIVIAVLVIFIAFFLLAIAVVVVMFLNIIFSFALCMTVKS